jgi:hypothetical protein
MPIRIGINDCQAYEKVDNYPFSTKFHFARAFFGRGFTFFSIHA